jgi:TIR domain
MRVFISFASKDREAVRRFEAALRLRRPEVSCFLDERALTGGVYWIPRLGEELCKADVVLLLLGETIGHLGQDCHSGHFRRHHCRRIGRDARPVARSR